MPSPTEPSDRSHPPALVDDQTGMSRRRLLKAGAATIAGAAATLTTTRTAGASSASLSSAAPGPSTPPAADRPFEGSVVAITGGTSGIGEATVRAFAAAGALVTFCGRRVELGRTVERSVRDAGGDVTYLPADVRDFEQVRSFVDDTVTQHGRLDIAFNNAGIQVNRPLHETSVEEWTDSMNTNARGVFLAMQHEIRHMLVQGHGIIVVNSSIGAMVARPGLSLYQATKRAVLALVTSAALEYGSSGIRINAIAPGIVDTAMIRPPGLDDETWAAIVDALGAANADGLGRVAAPSEIATAVLTLCRPELSYMTGSIVPVDGGITAGRPLILPSS